MIAIRRGRPSDATAIGAVHVAAWRSAYPGILPDGYLAQLSVPRQAGFYDNAIRSGVGVHVAAASGLDIPGGVSSGGPRIVGFVSADRARNSGIGDGEIETLYVLDDWRDRGLGRRLIRAAASHLAASGCRSAYCWVLRDNPSRWFYQRLGGKPVAEAPIRVGGSSIMQTAFMWDPIERLLQASPQALVKVLQVSEPTTDRVLILDFGSQFTQLIARRVRENGVYCEIWPYTADPARISAYQPKAVILSGGPASVYEGAAPRAPHIVFELGCPVLGICYGLHTMCAELGGEVQPSDHREFGRAVVDVVGPCALFHSEWQVGARAVVWMSHGDRVTRLPPGFRAVAVSEATPFAAVADDSRRFYGVLFHPEVVHTAHGAQLLRNFTHDIAHCRGDWTMAGFRSHAIAQIRQQVGGGRVICGLSGGVDSSVAAVLLHEAIGPQLTCIFVDHGMLRQGEAEQVVTTFRDRFNIHLVHRDASDVFLAALEGVSDPEVKRKTIGRLFIEVFEEEAKHLGGADYLAQGTLYPDVIESVSFTGGPSVTIKSHHNVGGLPERMRMRLVEPLRELFKDEVRVLGRELGMPEEIVGRHPFPGPGLAIRIPGVVTRPDLDLLRRADTIFLEEIRAAGLYDAIWQAFAVLLPVRTVGVMGDGRTYDKACALRAVTSTDGMTADVFPFDMGFLTRVANRIVNEVRGINRVTYDITSKPPGTIEWE